MKTVSVCPSVQPQKKKKKVRFQRLSDFQRLADIVLMSEIPGSVVCEPRQDSYHQDSMSSLYHRNKSSGNGFALMDFGDFVAISCYWRPGTTLQEYTAFLDDLNETVRNFGGRNIILAGDFNAWNVEWGSAANNQRDELLSDLTASAGLVLVNRGNVPTFFRGVATSVIDVTFYRGIQIYFNL